MEKMGENIEIAVKKSGIESNNLTGTNYTDYMELSEKPIIH